MNEGFVSVGVEIVGEKRGLNAAQIFGEHPQLRNTQTFLRATHVHATTNVRIIVGPVGRSKIEDSCLSRGKVGAGRENGEGWR